MPEIHSPHQKAKLTHPPENQIDQHQNRIVGPEKQYIVTEVSEAKGEPMFEAENSNKQAKLKSQCQQLEQQELRLHERMEQLALDVQGEPN